MGTDSPAKDTDNTLRIGILTPVDNLDPVHAQFFIEELIGSQIYDPPFAHPKSSGKSTEPLILAESLRDESGGEGLSFSAPVRNDLLFSDGTPLTPQHVIDSLGRAEPLRQQADFSLDGDRITFKLKRPNARFDLVLSQAYTGIVLPKGGKLLGTGSYMIGEESTPRELRFERNPHSRIQPKIDNLVFKTYEPDSDGKPTSLQEALESGEVDFTTVLSQEDVRDLKRVRKYIERGNSAAALYLNTEREVLKDQKVRQAIAMSIDRLELTGISYSTPVAYAAKNILPLSMSMWRDGLTFDMNKAKALLDEADGPKPDKLLMHVTFGARPYLPHPMRTAEYIAKQLGQLGIKVTIQQSPDGEDFVKQAQRGNYDIFLSGWVAESEDPAEFLETQVMEQWIPSEASAFTNHCNISRWRNQGVEGALHKLRREPSEENQRAVLGIIAEEVPLVPLMTGSVISVHSYRVKGFEPTPLGIPYFSQLELSR